MGGPFLVLFWFCSSVILSQAFPASQEENEVLSTSGTIEEAVWNEDVPDEGENDSRFFHKKAIALKILKKLKEKYDSSTPFPVIEGELPVTGIVCPDGETEISAGVCGIIGDSLLRKAKAEKKKNSHSHKHAHDESDSDSDSSSSSSEESSEEDCGCDSSEESESESSSEESSSEESSSEESSEEDCDCEEESSSEESSEEDCDCEEEESSSEESSEEDCDCEEEESSSEESSEEDCDCEEDESSEEESSEEDCDCEEEESSEESSEEDCDCEEEEESEEEDCDCEEEEEEESEEDCDCEDSESSESESSESESEEVDRFELSPEKQAIISKLIKFKIWAVMRWMRMNGYRGPIQRWILAEARERRKKAQLLANRKKPRHPVRRPNKAQAQNIKKDQKKPTSNQNTIKPTKPKVPRPISNKNKKVVKKDQKGSEDKKGVKKEQKGTDGKKGGKKDQKGTADKKDKKPTNKVEKVSKATKGQKEANHKNAEKVKPGRVVRPSDTRKPFGSTNNENAKIKA